MKYIKDNPILIFFTFGGLLLIIAFFLAKGDPNFSYFSFFGGAVVTVAFVFLTVALINLLWTVLGGDPLQKLVAEFHGTLSILGDSQETGLRRFKHASGNLWHAGDWMKHLLAAEYQVDLLGYTLHVWSRGAGFEEEVLKLVKRGVRVRVLNMHPDNPNFGSVINQEIPGITGESSVGEARGAEDLFRNIERRVAAIPASEQRGRFEYRQVKTGTVLCQICRFDGMLTAIQYLYSEVASRTPIVLVNGSDTELFQVYAREFERLWELNQPNSPTKIAE
jgi:hypothetical protein